MRDGKILQRYAGHLVLATVALLLVVAGRMINFGELPAVDDAIMEARPASAARLSLSTIAGDSAEPTPEFDVAELPIIADSGISPALVPVTYKPEQPNHEFITYTVQTGDTAIRIAERFGIQEETILGGNAFLSNDAGQLMAGTTIIILPIDGVLHDVVEGDTVEGLAAQYGVAVEDIVAYEPNNLEFPYRLYPGTQILVPGAVREVFVWDPPSMATSSSSGSSGSAGITVAVPGTGTFVWPVGARRITQQFWYGHQAIDVGLVTGSPVYASDTGTVTYAAWSPYCYGNLIVINHGNGFETFYAHLDGFNVSPGQTVYQGGLIGWSGNTGCSSGPHLHFEIRFSKAQDNPLSYLP
ncbi:MAG TPA: M23 family metallopeptidase [Candidatus Sulfomarinibacteraceae bacterium]|nr:M23 family metallopeptidase [Candidatus Sulfomarinibacteraceae bacterium]